MAQWLLCYWQGRAVQAPWWSVFLLVVGIIALEMLLPARRQRAWPELFRAGVSLLITMYASFFVGCNPAHALGCRYVTGVVFEEVWGGRALVPIILLVSVGGMVDLDYDELFCAHWGLDTFLSVVGLSLVVLLPEPGAGSNLRGDWLGWMQLVLSLHMLLVGNMGLNSSSEGRAWRWGSSLLLCVIMAVMAETTKKVASGLAWVLVLVPCLCVREKRLISRCIVPILETLCHAGQYPLKVIPFTPHHHISLSLIARRRIPGRPPSAMCWCSSSSRRSSST